MKRTSRSASRRSERTLRETSDGLYAAFKARLGKMKAYADEMGAA